MAEQYELDAVHLYLIDDSGQNLVLQATAGQEPASNEPIALTSGLVVTQVVSGGQPVLLSSIPGSDTRPATRSQLAMPLLVERQAIGVLDLHSDTAHKFTADSFTAFEATATQLAISIDSAQQWTLSLTAQQKSEQALRQLTHQAWDERLRSYRQELGFAYDLSAVKPTQGSAEGDVSLPVSIQNYTIGQLAVQVPPGHTLSADEHALLKAVTQQLAQKMENLRLFDETQRRASREQLARQITDKIRASGDIESALQTAARELSSALGVSRATIDLEVTASTEEAGTGNGKGS
jgi:GAF domain-containing protein